MMQESIPYFSQWPKIDSAITQDPKIEQEIRQILAQMTLEEKIGQMIQPNLRGVTPEQAKQYKLGSILNGGGTWVDENKHATAQQWVDKADQFWQALEEAYADRPFRIPFMWATDAVHGHNNVYNATLFPHNIGLGCSRDPDLIEQIGQITAREIAATGLDWTFAPTVAAPRNLRWGRTYEGYAEDCAITYHYAACMVKGLQGDASQLNSDHKVISSVKHWVGDGGTQNGIDRGNNDYDEDLLRNLHAGGYFSGLNAGAQVVMCSFNRWQHPANYDHSPQDNIAYNHKIHGSKYLLTDVLKNQMGFDGLIITDWNGHAEVSQCSNGDASYAINAGNDILMVTEAEHWIAVIEKTLRDVRAGVIAIQRIDDAVLRILRVKQRAGLWSKPRPSQRSLAGSQTLIGATPHRLVARQAVRKSMVLLKNKQQILPLSRQQKILLTGSAANNITKQIGGWNLTWQGDENVTSDIPNGMTIKAALEHELGANSVCFDPELRSDLSQATVAIVAFGEDPYAEMLGDIQPEQSLNFAQLKASYAQDCQRIQQLQQAGVKIISLFFSGRPLYVNPQINQSDAFIAAFLPGSEGLGITDLLLRTPTGEIQYDFVGKLSFSWPNRPDSFAVHRIPPHIQPYQIHYAEQAPTGEHTPLFEYGYGLNYSSISAQDLDNLPEEPLPHHPVRQTNLTLFGSAATRGQYVMQVCEHNTHQLVSRNNPQQFAGLTTQPYDYLLQQDSILCHFYSSHSSIEIVTIDGQPQSIEPWLAEGQLCFDIRVNTPVTAPVWLSMGEETQQLDISPQFTNSEPQFYPIRQTIKAMISRSQSERSTLFRLQSEQPAQFVLANIRFEQPKSTDEKLS
ncbi:glycoside hydrolase family 3 protein (plasmid) [Vibrio sp. HDW18]|uniref:glycoside hydrolase family 3 protein n=1 Tax=Vibrio sp. HDW18 TaxID=2714948 RepID=UPI0014093591|nr:glycoside hydrolase family 3 protein [Vibrio sp. HDW18]QIL86900.1 glycoside hydrolase family 3 protein [Vibrio sp. HDW18]